MIKNSSYFLLNVTFGILISFIILITAEQLGFWKKNWKAEHTIIENSSFHSATQSTKAPRHPAPIIQIALAPLGDSQKISNKHLVDISPSLDQTQLSIQTLRLQQADFSGTITLSIFEDKLKGAKLMYPPCPSEKAVYWTNCYGRYDFPWGEIYSGLWSEDKLNGGGRLTKENGDSYLGEFSNNQYSGCGLLIKTDGTTQSGVWKNGQLVEDTNLCNIYKTD